VSDPLDRRLRDFTMDLPTTTPASPADVRRRGDRLRRRRTTMAAAGAALAVALVATPVAVLAGDDGSRDAEPAPAVTTTATPTPTDSATAGGLLREEFLPPADELPERARLTPWQEAGATDGRLVGCQPDGADLGATEVISRFYTAGIAEAAGLPGGDAVAADLRITVLQFASDGEAEAAEDVVLDWVRTCDDPAGTELDDAVALGGLVETDQVGTYGTWTYANPDACGGDGCDSAWFERMGVLADLGRMVVVSYREAGGPTEPEGLDRYMQELMLRAAGGSMPG
jgi:hypothetical protein